jgi:hypothetical protein
MATIVVIVITLVSVECLIFCFSVIFQCGYVLYSEVPMLLLNIIRKPSLYWTLSLTPQGTCISETKNLLGAGIINTVADFIVVVLPMPTVWKLKLPLQQQIIVLMLFSAGFIVICAGAVRTYYLYQVTIGWDRTWTAFPAWVSSSVELYVGIVISLPSLTPTNPLANTRRSVPPSQQPNNSSTATSPNSSAQPSSRTPGPRHGSATS